MKVETLNKIIQTSLVTSKDLTRYHLAHVLIFAEKDSVKMVATDGHRLVQREAIDPELAGPLGSDRFFVSPENIRALKILAKECKRIGGTDSIRSESDSGKPVIRIGHAAAGIQTDLRLEKEVGQFPDFESVIPKEYGENPTVIGLNAEYLEGLLKSLREDPKNGGVKLTIKSPLHPVKVEVKGSEGFAVLMPMRV